MKMLLTSLRDRHRVLGCAVLLCSTAAALADGPAAQHAQRLGVPQADDPATDGWRSEAFNQQAGEMLQRLADQLARDFRPATVDLGWLTDSRYSGPSLSLLSLRPIPSPPDWQVSRLPEPSATDPVTPESVHRGAEGLARALTEHLEALARTTDRHVKIKIVGIEPLAPGTGSEAGERLRSQQHFSASGKTATGSVELHARWELLWQQVEGEQPKLLSLQARDIELVRYLGSSGTTGDASSDPGAARASQDLRGQAKTSVPTLYTDATKSVLGHVPAYREQLQRGTPYWLGRLEAALGTDIMGHSGISIADVDGDGLDDLYLPQMGGLTNRLFLQQPDGTLADHSAASGLDWLDRSHAALFLDLDNDGDQDLWLASTAALVLFENDGFARFTERARFPEARYTYSLAAADYDLDGDLDLYAARYSPVQGDPVEESVDVPNPVPYHDARNGAPSFLFRNDGDLLFSDVTAEVGLAASNDRWSFAASWEDYDNDGDPDLYVANDFGRNNLYRNDRGRFVDVALAAGVEDIASGMSVTWGDVNRDGWMDLYVSNMFSSAGNRVTFQDRFRPDFSDDVRRQVQRLARGNTLYINRQDGTFEDLSESLGVTMGRWAWSSRFVDLNNDAWQDLVVLNGFLTAEDSGDL